MSNKVEYVRHTQDVKYCDQARSVELRKHSSTDCHVCKTTFRYTEMTLMKTNLLWLLSTVKLKSCSNTPSCCHTFGSFFSPILSTSILNLNVE